MQYFTKAYYESTEFNEGGCVMIVYQVLNEQNQVYTEFTDYNKALNSAQDLTLWDEYHYYRVAKLELEELQAA